MFLSLVIGRFKGYLRCKYSKNNKNIKNKLYLFQPNKVIYNFINN
jgi:hypothetical protein